jgi:hypothetical protein
MSESDLFRSGKDRGYCLDISKHGPAKPTLGIFTFNSAQADLINDLFGDRVAGDQPKFLRSECVSR